ncbi:MAG: ATP-binding protein [Gemmatimonadetes bacterium]|nr:ATP-binding protein [Gemmatimonadota bacterium]
MYALCTGSGKDATLALHRARDAGLDVGVGLNLHDAASGRVAFHGTRAALVEAHCRALGLEPLLIPVEAGAFEPRFVEALRELAERGARGVVFGNVHLADVRAWYEERVRAAGLEHVEPLWGEPPADLVRDVVRLRYRALVVSVDLEQGRPSWLGRELDDALVAEMEAHGADPCGERGEYHTFVHDGPAFSSAVPVARGDEVEMKGHRLLDLVLRTT